MSLININVDIIILFVNNIVSIDENHEIDNRQAGSKRFGD